MSRGALAPGDQHSADHQIRLAEMLADRVGVAENRLHVFGHHIVEIAQPIEIDIHDRDIRAEPGGDFRGAGAHHPAAQDQHVRRRHARHSAEQDAAAHHRLLEILRPFLNAHLPGDLAHRRQAGKLPLAVANRLVRDRDDLALQAPLRQLRTRRQVEISENNLSRSKQADLRSQRLLHLHDHVRRFEDRINLVDNRSPTAPR